MIAEIKQCYSCKKFIQDSDPEKDLCSGSENCYAMVGFQEYESIDVEES